MTHYRVTWEIDAWADSPQEAAKEALKIQRDPESVATVFKVQEVTAVAPVVTVDLMGD